MESTSSKAYEASSETTGDGVRKLIAIFRRRLRLFGGVVLSVLAVALVVIISQPPKFTATATLQLITKKQAVVTVTPNQDPTPDSSTVDTEVEVLRSRAIALRVIHDLHLEQDPEFNARLRKPSLLEKLKASVLGFAPDAARPQTALSRSGEPSGVVDALAAGLTVSRAGLTYLINLNYTSTSPAKAATLANAFTRAYLNAQLDAKFNDTSDANDFLNDRLKQLRAQVETADTQLQQYKIANNLMSSQGATLTEQEISTLDQQLALTRAQEAEATARLNTARRQLANGSTGEDVGEALSSPVIQQLRQQRAVASQKVADMQGRYGDRHPEMLKAKRELADLDSQIQGEIKRIISNLEAQAQVAKQRTASIQGSVGQSRGKLAGNNRALVRLNELQRNADAARTLYENLLNRFKETSVEKGLQQTDARVVSPAAVPQSSSTRKGLMALFAALVAGIAGVAAVMLAELLDNAISDGGLIENELDASYLGSIPLLSSSVDSPEMARIGPERYVVEKPLSSFAEAIRSLNASVLFSRLGVDIKVIAVSSSLPGEGKTTSSICLGRTLAMSGKRVVLVDCDLRQRSVKKILDAEPGVGLLELLNGDAALDDVLIPDNKSSAMILPLSNAAYTPKDVFGSDAMAKLLDILRARFDTVILDTAPVLLVTETRTLAAMSDAVVLLVRWRRTSKRAVMASLKLLREANAPLAGAALTQVDLAQTSSLSALDPAAYYKSYKKYYLE